MLKVLLGSLMLLSPTAGFALSTEEECLAKNIFFEARQASEGIDGRLAVAQVTLNRVEDHRYPNTICDVVWEDNAFSWTHDGLTDNPEDFTNHADKVAWEEVQEMVKDISEDGTGLEITSTHYHSKKVTPFWADHYDFDGQVGTHLFFTNNTPHK